MFYFHNHLVYFSDYHLIHPKPTPNQESIAVYSFQITTLYIAKRQVRYFDVLYIAFRLPPYTSSRCSASKSPWLYIAFRLPPYTSEQPKTTNVQPLYIAFRLPSYTSLSPYLRLSASCI